jgi:hypothetical protein
MRQHLLVRGSVASSPRAARGGTLLRKVAEAAQFHTLPESKHLVFTGRVAIGRSSV